MHLPRLHLPPLRPALHAWLTGAVASALAVPAAAQTAADGAALYGQHCAACHQPDGSGAVGLAPALKGEHWVKLGADKAYLPTVILKGLSGPIKVNGQNFVGSMPAFAQQLDDAAIAALSSYLRTMQGSPTPYSADEIKPLREAAGSPPQSRQRRAQILGS